MITKVKVTEANKQLLESLTGETLDGVEDTRLDYSFDNGVIKYGDLEFQVSESVDDVLDADGNAFELIKSFVYDITGPNNFSTQFTRESDTGITKSNLAPMTIKSYIAKQCGGARVTRVGKAIDQDYIDKLAAEKAKIAAMRKKSSPAKESVESDINV